MQGIKATTESREPKDLNNSSAARSDQRNNQFVATGILSTWELPTHLQYTIPDANNQLHLLLLTHEIADVNSRKSSCSARELATGFDDVGGECRRFGNPDVGLATNCCLCKIPAFGYEDQSLGGCIWLERDREVADFGHVFVRAGYTAGRGADPARGAPEGC
ncbi:hypothetical protein F511_18684 [Dorcoceras hygrometricum]|uniref:Uncharacterized protein n=1 Tax=Dorcoceras hygrometricum TaxID=472368 RepID=A0A2Z7AHN6_9LAMI|nr:hypothetical protein F511_18684 [Dorcoceras hygrometricum]